MRLSQTEENYIKAIYKLAQSGNGLVSTNHLSAALQNRAASVTDMLGKLSKKNLISYKKYRGVALTQNGTQIALTVIRKHRLWECFLVQKLKFSWDEIHEVAEQLEHIQSERLIERLEEFLGFPKQDPHGEPIPNALGEFQNKPQIILLDAKAGDKVKVIMVEDEGSKFLQYLNKQRIGIGSVLSITKVNDSGKSITVKTLRQNLLLSEDIARHIFVQRI